MQNVKIGDSVLLVAPSGNKRTVIVTDVIRCVFSGEPIALEFKGINGETTLPIKFFKHLNPVG